MGRLLTSPILLPQARTLPRRDTTRSIQGFSSTGQVILGLTSAKLGCMGWEHLQDPLRWLRKLTGRSSCLRLSLSLKLSVPWLGVLSGDAFLFQEGQWIETVLLCVCHTLTLAELY